MPTRFQYTVQYNDNNNNNGPGEIDNHEGFEPRLGARMISVNPADRLWTANTASQRVDRPTRDRSPRVISPLTNNDVKKM